MKKDEKDNDLCDSDIIIVNFQFQFNFTRPCTQCLIHTHTHTHIYIYSKLYNKSILSNIFMIHRLFCS